MRSVILNDEVQSYTSNPIRCLQLVALSRCSELGTVHTMSELHCKQMACTRVSTHIDLVLVSQKLGLHCKQPAGLLAASAKTHSTVARRRL